MRTGLRHGLAEALKARDRVAVTALRSALAAIDNAEAVPLDRPPDTGGTEHIASAAAGVGAAEAQRRRLDEAELRSIVRKEAEDRRAASAEYERLGRRDAAERLRAEADVLNRYLPPTP